MILVSNPLHYKRLITKTKIHTAFWFSVFAWSTEFLFVFVFSKADTVRSQKHWCIPHNTPQKIPFNFLFAVNFGIFATTLILSYVVMTFKLYQRSKSPVTSTSSSETNTKVTKVAWLAVGTFLVFYLPVVLGNPMTLFIPQPYPVSLLVFSDISYFIWLYLNNLANPLLYFATLKDFREGYKNLLGCGNKRAKEPNGSTSTCSTLSQSQTAF